MVGCMASAQITLKVHDRMAISSSEATLDSAGIFLSTIVLRLRATVCSLIITSGDPWKIHRFWLIYCVCIAGQL